MQPGFILSVLWKLPLRRVMYLLETGSGEGEHKWL